jgi:hypothetical protein
MNIEEVRQIVTEHNNSIDDFINNKLGKLLNASENVITMDKWFKAQDLIRQQKFYEKGHKILVELRNNGYDVKMNMQSDKLIF